MYSDHGKNFVGAKNEFRSLQQFINDNSKQIFESATNLGIQWHFIPPAAPHFGGIWEAGVKCVKHHLKRVSGSASLTYEDLNTLLTQIEAILNSRPISPLSSDPADLSALTPALVGRPLTTIPEDDFKHTPETRLSQYQRIQRLTQHFWERWCKEYVSELQQRSKWKIPRQSSSRADGPGQGQQSTTVEVEAW